MKYGSQWVGTGPELGLEWTGMTEIGTKNFGGTPLCPRPIPEHSIGNWLEPTRQLSGKLWCKLSYLRSYFLSYFFTAVAPNSWSKLFKFSKSDKPQGMKFHSLDPHILRNMWKYKNSPIPFFWIFALMWAHNSWSEPFVVSRIHYSLRAKVLESWSLLDCPKTWDGLSVPLPPIH